MVHLVRLRRRENRAHRDESHRVFASLAVLHDLRGFPHERLAQLVQSLPLQKVGETIRVSRILESEQMRLRRCALRLDSIDSLVFRPLIEDHLGDLYAESGQPLQGSISAVSKPIFASKYTFESSRRDLHNALLCTALQSFFVKILLKYIKWQNMQHNL